MAFAAFLSQQADLGSKWAPSFVRIVTEFPMTQTNKILKRELVTQQWRVPDELWLRPAKSTEFEPFSAG